MKLIKGRFYHVDGKVMEYIGHTIDPNRHLFLGDSDLATEINTRYAYNVAKLEAIAEMPATEDEANEVIDTRKLVLAGKGREMERWGTH